MARKNATPIEEKLEQAFEELFVERGISYGMASAIDPVSPIEHADKEIILIHGMPSPGRVFTFDFLLVIGVPGGVRIAFDIECDGHDFHFRTKEQAENDRARDRSILLKNLVPIRFTGREITRNPRRCAEEALEIAIHSWNRMCKFSAMAPLPLWTK